METEKYREINNILIRKYKVSSNKPEAFGQIINFNFDFVNYIIKTYFKEYIDNQTIYSIGLIGIMEAVQIYEMDKMGSFEEFMLACIKDEIDKFIEENKGFQKTK